MFCGQCGKKVHDNMLFCPFCGTALVIPDQEELEEEKQNVPEQSSFRLKKGKVEDERQKQEEEFVPLFANRSRSEDDGSSLSSEDKSTEDDLLTEDEPDTVEDIETDTDQDRSVPTHPEAQHRENQHRRNTFIPVRDVAPDDLFLDAEEEDDYDAYDDDDYDSEYDEYEFDDKEDDEGFVARHKWMLITIVTVLILLLAAAGFLLFTDPGQGILARVDLASNPEAYNKVGYTEYQNEHFDKAAEFFEKAVSKDTTNNYEYRHSAMVAHYAAGNIEKAADMAIKCIELKPDDPEPYNELSSIYVGTEMPARIEAYIHQGYQATGDEHLNMNNWLN